MVRQRHSLLSLAFVCLLLLAGAGMQPAMAQEQIELRVWDPFTNPQESDAADAIYQSFTDQNPNITITREVIDTDTMRQTVNTAISSGTGPDVIFYDAGAGYAGVLAEAGLLLPLDDMAEQYGWKERIAPSALEAASLGGQLFGLPLQVDLIGMYYNQTVLEREGYTVPQNVQELVTLCQQASEAGYVPMALGGLDGWPLFHQFSMVSNNMIGIDEMRSLLFESQGRWDSPEMVQAIDAYFVQLRDAGCFGEDVNALTNDDAISLFQSGQALMYPSGSWAIQDLSPENMPDMTVEYQPFPGLEGGAGSFWLSGIGSAYYITSTSQNQEAAGQFLDHLFSPEVAQQWVADAGFFVPMSVDTSGMDLSPLQVKILEELAKGAAGEIQFGFNIDVIAPPEFNDAMSNGFQRMLAGDKTAEQQAADLQAAWEANWEPIFEASPPATPAS